MGKILKHNVFVSDNPPAGNLVALLAGQEVPDWAEEQLKDSPHLFREPEDANTIRPRNLPADKPKPKAKAEIEKTEKVEEAVEVPKKTASRQTWVNFATYLGIKLPEDISRNEIVERVESERPEVFES